MDSNNATLVKKLTLTLEKDLARFASELVKKEHGSSDRVQSEILTQSTLPSPCSETGAILMEELVKPRFSNIVLKVGDDHFLCHKEVLVERCKYFGAMLSNQWTEADSEIVILSGVDPHAVAAVLCFLYGGSVDLPEFCSLVDVLHVADMYGVTQLTEAIKLSLRTGLCHSFHKPCKALQWNTVYFNLLWPTKSFAALPTDLHRSCLKAVVNSITIINAVHLLKKADKLLSSITRVRWTDPLVNTVTELMTCCCGFIVNNVLAVTRNKTLVILFQGMGWKIDVVERILVEIGDKLNVENVCSAHLAISRLMHLAEKDNWIKNKKPPKPAVLTKKPMTVKPRKPSKSFNSKTKQVSVGVVDQEPPEPKSIISVEELALGSILEEVAVWSNMT